MVDATLDISLFIAGLIIGLLISIAAGAVLQGLCEWLAPGSSQRKLGLLMLMLYVPVLAFVWRHKIDEVAPMVIGVVISGLVVSAVVYVHAMRTTRFASPMVEHQKLSQ